MSNDIIDAGLAVSRLSRDLAKSSTLLSTDEARFLVDYYYICQNDRIRFNNQERALKENEEPTTVIEWLGNQSTVLEKQITRALDKYTENHPVGKWIRSLVGFGPVLTAGFIANIDISKSPTAGHLWSYAGLVPGQKWEKGQKRPWNANLKKLCFLAGDVAMKLAGHPDSYYGKVLNERRAKEMQSNLNGEYSQKAIADQPRYNPSTEAYAWVMGCYKAEDIKKLYEANMSLASPNIKKFKGEIGSGTPMLPPAHIVARARRYAMKLFLSHLHEVWYETEFKQRVPVPFVIQHMGHVHRIDPPNYVSPYVG